VLALLAPASSQAQAKEAGARLKIAVFENGDTALASFLVRQAGSIIKQGSSDAPVALNPGNYDVEVQLHGAVDQPKRLFSVKLSRGATETISAQFETTSLEVVIHVGNQRRSGMAKIQRNGTQVASIGSGLKAKISVGTYDIDVVYRNQVQQFSAVSLIAHEHRVVSASFD